MDKIEVTGCNDCPCCDMLDMTPGYLCKIHRLDENGQPVYIKESRKDWSAVTPKWCPLKQSPITISLKP